MFADISAIVLVGVGLAVLVVVSGMEGVGKFCDELFCPISYSCRNFPFRAGHSIGRSMIEIGSFLRSGDGRIYLWSAAITFTSSSLPMLR